jgi:CheY-like chemotaxis protein
VNKQLAKPSVFNLSVEEENLAAIPFAVLERRVGKRIGKIEIRGNKILPDGTQMKVLWQVQGNNEMGLPTEQDLDIFVALGVLTFQSNFSKTVGFTGREIARILGIQTVHGKFYQRLKVAMDRFIPLRFRALSETDRQEEVKWLNIFQEASFSLDRSTGRCTGSVTWTDKLIQSMDSGFFRLLDAGRYIGLDGITAKHLYRFLAVAFEKTDLVVMDARKLATEHLGIFNVPKYLSRLMQTLEPAFDQLVRIGVMRSYHVVSAEDWTVALHRHEGYVPERKTLMQTGTLEDLETARAWSASLLERAGFTAKAATAYSERYAGDRMALYCLQRAARLLEELKQEDVLAHVALALVRRPLDAGFDEADSLATLDWCEIALEVCRQKRNQGQTLKNLPGLLIKIVKDEKTRQRAVSAETADFYIRRFRDRERAALQQAAEQEERELVLKYEQYRQKEARRLLDELAPEVRKTLWNQCAERLRLQDRFSRIPAQERDREIEQLVLYEIAKKEVTPFHNWSLRARARQAVLPFRELDSANS